MDYSNGVLLFVRGIGQRLGILRPMVRIYRNLFSRGYEDRFDAALIAEIRQGDVVWDVGANVGIYTSRFSDLVGQQGVVIGFEPSPGAFAELEAACAGRSNVRLMPLALSDAGGMADFDITDASAPTNSLRKSDAGGQGKTHAIKVRVARGDDLVKGSEVPGPSIMKIDVEGFEAEVLRGMSGLLRASGVRGIFVEVHFQELNRRGLSDAPREITRTLEQSGFHVRWCDPSHIVALRQKA